MRNLFVKIFIVLILLQGCDSASVPVKKSKTKEAEPRTIAQAKSMGKDYFMVTDKKGDDIKKAAVTAEELKKSGLSLRDYLNKKRGLKRKTKK